MKKKLQKFWQGIYEMLLSKKTFYVLCALYLIAVVINILLFDDDMRGGDHWTYLYYTKGFEKGRYTYWYFLKDYIPDTFRNPGFGIIIYLLSFISDSPWTLVVLNLFSLLGGIYFLFKIVDKLAPASTYIIKNILLLFLLLNVYMTYYISLYYPEMVMFFLITLSVYLDLHLLKNKISTYVILGVLYGIIFQVRPVFLFYPFIRVVVEFFIQRKHFSLYKNSVMVFIYLVSMLPYGYWNYRNHGVYSVTSIEGGGGVMHLGYWGFKMPDYLETRYWRNVVMRDLISFTPQSEVNKNIEAFNKEWDYIDSSCAKYLTEKDARNIPVMRKYNYLFVTYNGRYTYEREKLLKKLTIQHFLEDPVFTIKIKVYTFFRLWMTGIKVSAFKQTTLFGIAKGFIPSIVTGLTFLMAIIFIPLAFIRRKLKDPVFISLLVLIVYYGSIHVLFALQARYTIPVRPLLMLITSVALYELFFRKMKPE